MAAKAATGSRGRRGGTASSFFTTVGLLALVFGVLFLRSFHPDYVVFSNDGPLGGVVAELNRLPATLTGLWADLNWIGDRGVTPSPAVSTFLRLVTGPVVYSKVFCPLALIFLGLCAWFCFHEWKLSPLACRLGALAAALSSHFFSTACWGVGAQIIAMGMCFVAIGLAGTTSEDWRFWIRLTLAGMAVGISIMEAYDNGAIFSLLVAAFVLFQSLISESSPAKGVWKGVVQVGMIALFAGLCATQALDALITTQIKGVTGAQDRMTPEQRWDWATQWSIPKKELPRIFISGLFGYRMDTPQDMTAFQEWFQGGAYWGEVGRVPALDRLLEEYHASGREGSPPGVPRRAWRLSGGGEYAGVLVVVVALWSVAQSLCKRSCLFTPTQRKLIWFWAGAAVVSLLLALGRYAPFYRLFYALPHASNIRNASKFMHPFHWSLVILFAYGVHAMTQRYLAPGTNSPASSAAPLKTWWTKANPFDRRWTLLSVILATVSVVGWLVYSSTPVRARLETFVMGAGFDDPALAAQIVRFSAKEVGWFVVFGILAVSLLIGISSGRLVGKRSKWGGILLGILLVVDLVRADLPWIIYQNYVEKYETNPVIDFFRDKPYEHRVTMFPVDRFIDLEHLPPDSKALAPLYGQLAELYQIEWMQHHFQFYNIQALDDVQRPREAADFSSFERGALAHAPLRHWELTNTRYFLAPTGLSDFLNRQVDERQHRFRIASRFDLGPKPGLTATSYEQMTAVVNTNGQYAVFEFTGALPRAKLYAQWQASANDQATLNLLADTNFSPATTVLVCSPTDSSAANASREGAGAVEIIGYAPKKVKLRATATQDCVLLLNDKFDPGWKVTVDGKPGTVLRCNYIMRGVRLPAGDHTVEFSFSPPVAGLCVSLVALIFGLGLIAVLVVSKGPEGPLALELSPKRVGRGGATRQ